MPSTTTPRRPDEGVPTLLLAFLAGTVAMVGAIVPIGRTHSDWADVAAVARLLGLVALLGTMIRGQLRDREP